MAPVLKLRPEIEGLQAQLPGEMAAASMLITVGNDADTLTVTITPPSRTNEPIIFMVSLADMKAGTALIPTAPIEPVPPPPA